MSDGNGSLWGLHQVEELSEETWQAWCNSLPQVVAWFYETLLIFWIYVPIEVVQE